MGGEKDWGGNEDCASPVEIAVASVVDPALENGSDLNTSSPIDPLPPPPLPPPLPPPSPD